jgi:hypothetical protein
MGYLTSVSTDQIHELEMAGIDKDEVHVFNQRLRDCGLNSVDAFIKKNPVFARVAKMRIAQELSAAEHRAVHGGTRDANEAWIQYLFSRFMDGDNLDDFRENKCTFVTLNYDRCLEFELTKMLSNAYSGATWKEAAAAVGAIETIHLHGSIGPLPDTEPHYGMRPGPGEAQKAAQGILTLGEPGSEKEYEGAGERLRAAEVIFCLGFGFHKETIENLGMRNGTLAIHGTCQGLTQSEVNRIGREFAPRPFVELNRDGVAWNHRPRDPGPAVDYLRGNVDLLE